MNRIEVFHCPIKGNINHLLTQIESAKMRGAETYDCISGSIVFYKNQSEKEHLLEQQKKYTSIMKELKNRLKEIKENEIK